MKKIICKLWLLFFMILCQQESLVAQVKSKPQKVIPKIVVPKKTIPVIASPLTRKLFGEDPGEGGGGEGDPTPECLVANAGPNRLICNNNGPVQLGNGASQNYNYTYSWSPATGLSATDIPNPTANPSQTTTYTLTVTPQPNLIVNGSFEDGNTGFSTDYTYGIATYTPATYSVGSSPSDIYSWWCNATPTDGSYMYIGDGHATGTQRAWYQTINVTPGTTYQFAGQFMNIYNTSGVNDPNIAVKINGTTITAFGLSYNSCQWTPITATWSSGSSSTATIEIYSNPTTSSLNGNDFAMDNLALVGGDCPTTTSTTVVTVNTTPVITQASPIEWCFIYDEIKPLTLSTSTGSNLQWYKGGSAISGSNQSTYTEEYSTFGIPATNPRSFVYTAGNQCGISDPVTVVAKATSGKSGQIYFLSAYPNAPTCILWSIPTSNYFWDPNYSLQYSVSSPGQITSANSGGNLDLTMCIPASFPTTVTFSLSTTEFGCVTPWNAQLTFNGNPNQVPTLVLNSKKSFFTIKPDVSNNLIEKNILIYPNPAKTTFTVSSISEFDKIQIFSSKGSLVKTYNIKGRNATINTSSFQPGMYFVNIISAKKTSVTKVIVVK